MKNDVVVDIMKIYCCIGNSFVGKIWLLSSLLCFYACPHLTLQSLLLSYDCQS